MSGSAPLSRGSDQVWLLSRHRGRALLSRREQRVEPGGVGLPGSGELLVPRDALHAGGQERLALPGLDGVERHPGGLHARGAEPVHGGAGQMVQPGQDGDDPGQVHPLLAPRLGTAEVEVLDLGRVEVRHLGQHGLDGGDGEVVRPDLLQRALEGAPDRSAGRRDDDRFWHGWSLSAGGFCPTLRRRQRGVARGGRGLRLIAAAPCQAPSLRRVRRLARSPAPAAAPGGGAAGRPTARAGG